MPGFGKPKMAPCYYTQCDNIVRNLRPMATLRTIAQHLTDAGLLTPSGKPWDRQKLATYLRNRAI